MTLWAGQFGTELVHDFHPGVPASGLFWTEAIPPRAVTFDLDSGTASFQLIDYPMPDFTGEASGQPEISVAARVSMQMAWNANGVALSVRDPANEFAGTYRECGATIEWSATEEGFSYASDDDAPSETRFAQIGREQTGIFAAGNAS